MIRKLSSQTSEVIQAMRFPLMVFVLFVHSTIWTHVPDVPDALSEKTFKFITDMFSFNIGSMAVPAFFILSGFFFFWSSDIDNINMKWFFDRWRKRVHTLLIPYIIWNLLMALAVFIKDGLFVKFGLDTIENAPGLKGCSIISILWTGPMNLPLWYMRNLICMSLLAPVLFCIIRQFKWLSLITLGILYLVPLGYSLPGLDFKSVMFFSLGGWLGIYKCDPLLICRKFRIESYILAVAFFVVSTTFTGTSNHEYVLRYFWIAGMVAMFNIMDRVTQNGKAKVWLVDMSKYVFFIYAVHSIFILGWTKGGLLRLLGNSLPAEYASFFLIPVIVTVICVLLYKFLEKIIPGALKVSMGNR